MKKLASLILVLLLAVGVLAGCLPEASPPDEPTPPRVCTVHFYQGDKIISTIVLDEGKQITHFPSVDVGEGYQLKGWLIKGRESEGVVDFDSYRVTGDVNFVALITEVEKYTVTFDPNGGSGNMESMSINANTTAELKPNTFAREGYTFAGWATSPNGEVKYADRAKYEMGAESVTLYAVWKVNSYDIVFNPNGGSGNMESMSINANTTAELKPNTFARDGYTFAGWATSPNGAVEYADRAKYEMGAASVTLYAVWQVNSYDIVFNPNGGSGNMESMSINANSTAELKPNTFAREGYIFSGWATSPNGAVKYADRASFTIGTESVTLYAVWQRSEYHITYPGSENMQNPNPTTITLSQLPYTLQDLVVDDEHIFEGWYTDQGFENKIEVLTADSFGEDGTLDIYAKITLTEGLHYFLQEDQTYMVTSYTGSDTEVTVPATYKDKPVSGIYNQAFTNAPSVQKVILSDGIKWIDQWAFYNATNIKEVVLPSTLDWIGNYAFYGCSGLRGVALPQNLTIIGEGAFRGCNSLTSVSLPESLTSLGASAFYQCANLATVNIPSKVTVLPNYVFCECKALSTVTFAPDSQLESIGVWVFSRTAISSIDLPNSITSIGGYAFENCDRLESASLPESLTSIGEYAFYQCDSLQSVHIPSKVTALPDHIFNECKALSHVTFAPDSQLQSMGISVFRMTAISSIVVPEKVESIAEYAFTECDQLVSAKLPESLKSIGHHAFYQCNILQSVNIPSQLTVLPEHIFNECKALQTVSVPKDSHLERLEISTFRMTAITSIYLPSSVKVIGDYVFDECPELERVDIATGSQIESIGVYAFYQCKKLQSISLPASLTIIDEYAFYQCESLTAVNIAQGSRLDRINNSAFYECKQLRTMTLPDCVTSIGEWAFGYCKLLDVRVPASLTSMGAAAYYQSGIQYIMIPSGLTIVPNAAFRYCKQVNRLEFAADSQLTVIDAFAFDHIELGYYLSPEDKWSPNPAEKREVTIPDSVRVIGAQAFLDACIVKVNINPTSQLEVLGSEAFTINSFTSIYLPATLKRIDAYAFTHNFQFKTINYGGTMEQWNAIPKGLAWEVSDPLVVCTDGEVQY